MRDFLAFALLPRREDHSTPRFVQQHGAAFLTVRNGRSESVDD